MFSVLGRCRVQDTFSIRVAKRQKGEHWLSDPDMSEDRPCSTLKPTVITRGGLPAKKTATGYSTVVATTLVKVVPPNLALAGHGAQKLPESGAQKYVPRWCPRNGAQKYITFFHRKNTYNKSE